MPSGGGIWWCTSGNLLYRGGGIGGTPFPWWKECYTRVSSGMYDPSSNVPTEEPMLSPKDAPTKVPTNRPLEDDLCSIIPALMNGVNPNRLPGHGVQQW